MNQSTHRYSHVDCCARCIPLQSGDWLQLCQCQM